MWYLPLHGTIFAPTPLTRSAINSSPNHYTYVTEWIRNIRTQFGCDKGPFQLYPNRLRANQGYLTKMPADFVEYFPELRHLADSLSGLQVQMDVLNDLGAPSHNPVRQSFSQQSDEEYWVYAQGGPRRMTRRHHEVINKVSADLSSQINVDNPHPIDLALGTNPPVIVEGKTVKDSCRHAAREAVGQLLEYRHFNSDLLPEARLCILLDRAPEYSALTRYVEHTLEMLLTWWDGKLHAGPRSLSRFEELGISLIL